MKLTAIISLIFIAGILNFGCQEKPAKQPNILFISIDDLNDLGDLDDENQNNLL